MKLKSKQFLNTNFVRAFLFALFLTLPFQNIHAAPIPGENDRIGWSADGNRHDPDDWGATAMALAIFAKQGWQNKVVHIDYNNWLPDNTPFKSAEETKSVVEGAKKFKFTRTKIFDNQTDLEAAIDNVVAEINKSSSDSRFWYVQAGPFEVAYRALKKAKPEKRQYCILVSHSATNEKANKWPGQHGKDDCVALGAEYFFTTKQGKNKFGSGSFRKWQLVDWMKNSPCPEYRWVYSRLKKTAENKNGILDASDGGMAFVLATGDFDGNFDPKLRCFLGTDWAEPTSGHIKVDPTNSASLSMISSTVYPKSISFIVSQEDTIANSKPARWAIGHLQEALQAEDVDARVRSQIQTAPTEDRCVVVAGRSSSLAGALLKQKGITVPDTTEALGLIEGTLDGRPVLLACGSDARGLVYAVLELADRVQCGIAPMEALKVSTPIIEKPAVRIRSIYRTFTSDVEDLSWYNDREFWKHYLTELAKQRINRFSLTLGMGYNTPKAIKDSYFFFAYPFLVDVPGYDVYAVNLPDEERDRNLEMLKFISDETAARGMEFQLGLWSHGRDWPDSESVNYPIHGLTEENHGPYCRDALVMLLKACPAISGVTFRVHGESGVPHGTQGFWEVLFQAFGEVGRPIWIDMHGKNATQEQIDWALATGMPVSVSPKYWGEHQGLAYHQADIRRREKGGGRGYIEPASGVYLKSRGFTRYGYGDLMPEDREWEILHRIWPGTQKLLLSGDPALAVGYGRVSSFCGSLGVERLDPLVFKGRKGSGHPGGRCAYADKTLEPKWDFHKFLYTYRVWGRLVYNPDTDPDVWMRFLRSKFGDAAKPMEIALANASRVVKLITTAHGRSVNCTLYWPELYMNVPIVDEKRITTNSDTDSPMVFGNVPPMDPQLFSKMNEYAAALLEGKELPKYSPLIVAQWLEDMADTATRNLIIAESLVEDRSDVEFRRFYYDVKIQCGIANFFALKMRAAVLWHLYEGSGDTEALVEAIMHYTTARDAWVKMAEEAKAIYVEDITFGFREQERGHWADRVPAMDADIADMKEALAKANVNGKESSRQEMVRKAIQTVKTRPQFPTMHCQHTPAKKFQPGKPMKIELELSGEAKGVDLCYRHVNQAVNWQMTPMNKTGKKCQAVIPAEYTKTRYPMAYYFVIDMDEAGKAIYPGLDENQANMPYYVVRH
jgi:hypothetical protein